MNSFLLKHVCNFQTYVFIKTPYSRHHNDKMGAKKATSKSLLSLFTKRLGLFHGSKFNLALSCATKPHWFSQPVIPRDYLCTPLHLIAIQITSGWLGDYIWNWMKFYNGNVLYSQEFTWIMRYCLSLFMKDKQGWLRNHFCQSICLCIFPCSHLFICLHDAPVIQTWMVLIRIPTISIYPHCPCRQSLC